MQHLIVLLSLLISTSLAQHEDGTIDLGLPKGLKNIIHHKYEGTLRTSNAELPLTGELWYRDHVKSNKIELVDNINLEISGKQTNVKYLMLFDKDTRTINSYLIFKDRCLPTVFTEEQETLPEISEWRKIGSNKFERTITNRITFNKVLPRGTNLGFLGDQEHEVRLKIQITLDKNKIHHSETTVWIDGQRVAIKPTEVTPTSTSVVDESRFRVPAVCRDIHGDKLKVENLAMFFLGFVEGRDQEGMEDYENGMMEREGRIGDDDDHNTMNLKESECEKLEESRDRKNRHSWQNVEEVSK